MINMFSDILSHMMIICMFENIIYFFIIKNMKEIKLSKYICV